MPVEHIDLILDYEGKNLTHIIAYGFQRWGDDVQAFVVDSAKFGPFDTDHDLGVWMARVARLAHKALLR
jgi:hypothetical protein